MTGETKQWRVTVQLDGCHSIHADYPLLPGDILTDERDIGEGWMKHAPGLGMFGFVLTDEQVATLEPADDARWALL